MHGAMQGWTTMQRTENTRKMTEMINEHISKVPSEMTMPENTKSLQMVSEGAILNLHFLKNCSHRTEEYCAVEESKWTCWHQDGLLVWQQRSMNAENYSACTYYEQSHSPVFDKNDQATLAVLLAACSHGCTSHLRRLCKRTKKQRRMCRNDQLLHGSVTVTSFMLDVLESTTRVHFVSDRTVSKNTERTVYSTPKAVNICYTGTVNGTIEVAAIRTEMSQASKRGPCGSEIHIDTSMGVMQIFGNNSGSRKITCKAFLNVGDANFIVSRVCAMVRMCNECMYSCTYMHIMSCHLMRTPHTNIRAAQGGSKFRSRHAYAGPLWKYGLQDGFIDQRLHSCYHPENVAGLCLHTMYRRT